MYVPKLVKKRESNNTVWLSDIYSGKPDKVATHLTRIKYLNKIIPELYLALDIPQVKVEALPLVHGNTSLPPVWDDEDQDGSIEW